MNKRTDLNQQDIIDALRQLGCSVRDLSQIGKGLPDILVGYRGKNYLKLTSAEEEFIRGWRGQVAVITNFEDAVSVITEEVRSTNMVPQQGIGAKKVLTLEPHNGHGL
jgi:hypothetical protein